MRSRQRTKLMAGAGLATMILGALMVLVPVGAGATQPQNPGGNEECPAGTTMVAKFNWSGSAYVEEGGPGPVTITDGATAASASWTSTLAIAAVVVKGSTDAKIVTVAGDGLSGSFDSTGLTTPAGNEPAISNVKFCAGTPQGDNPKLTVTKKVATEDEFDITVSQGEFSETEELGNDDSIVVEDADGVYVISEDLPAGWQDPVIECGSAQTAAVEGGVSVEVAGEDVFCTVTNTPEESVEPDLTIEKVVAGTPPQGATFEVDVTLKGEADTLVADNEAIAVGDPHTETGAGTYVIEEVTRGGATSTSWACFAGESQQPFDSGSGFLTDEIDVDEADVRCVFTNTYTTTQTIPPVVTTTPEPASLTVVKDVTGDVPDEWEFTFRLGGDDNELFTLDGTAEGTTDEQTFELPAGDYSVREFDLPNDGSTLVDIDCLDGEDVVGDEDGDTVSLALAAGDDVTCTFTNNFVDVQPSEVTVPPTTKPTPSSTVPPTTAKPTQQVLGAQVTRTLPRTGNETRDLAGLGAALIGLGAALVVGSRRREDFVS